MAQVSGKTVKIGDIVGFKCDIEQYGEIVEITREYGRDILTLKPANGRFDGEYIRDAKTTKESSSDCWL